MHLNENLDLIGSWENSMADIKFSSNFGINRATTSWSPVNGRRMNTFMPGFDLEEVGHQKSGFET